MPLFAEINNFLKIKLIKKKNYANRFNTENTNCFTRFFDDNITNNHYNK